ncbi:hypothetical protein DENSPDRAFT_777058 [Dentipellis sp. KUC8613]|nr:hypothetical protein DENSPDRAFT_777058 [Dentipellis sp. KUC8613]
MAPAHAAHGRAVLSQPPPPDASDPPPPPEHGLFLEPMMGTPLAVYVHKDVDDRDNVVDLIQKNGGLVSPGYSGVTYILVDPHKESGQNLYRQYAGKKNKMILNVRWAHECVRAGALQTFQTNWAGCKVTGNEPYQMPQAPPQMVLQPVAGPSRQTIPPPPAPSAAQQVPNPAVAYPPMPQPMQGVVPSDGLGPHDPTAYAYQPYPPPMQGPPRPMHPATTAPPQSWQAANGIAPEQTQNHIPQQAQIMARGPYRDETWDTAYQPPPPNAMVPGPGGPYDYRPYRDDQAGWVSAPNEYYEQPQYDQTYEQAYMPEAGPSSQPAGSEQPATPVVEGQETQRGRKRTRPQQAAPAPPAASLVVNRGNPQARSPTPPSRVIKSTYGGNLFTADDVMYLKKYIDYCQEQGLVLSLREICERVAVKAPHHTFYSWRRYCNKHQIRLGGYAMAMDGDEGVHDDRGEEEHHGGAGPGPGAIAAAKARAQAESAVQRTRSPTPPRALFRSTTGKGVAFTDEDVTFMIKLLDYRRSQGKLDMVSFWKEIASKVRFSAPHHSRASWMKFYRRHKHELNHTETDEPLPQAPEKKMRYTRSDDVLLARFFYTKPEGTSDKIFQAFGRLHPHHPWKGWQEHHRIHKAKIDHLIQRLSQGDVIDEPDTAE